MNQQKPIVDYCKQHGIFVEAYAPLMRAHWDVPAILEVAKKVGLLRSVYSPRTETEMGNGTWWIAQQVACAGARSVVAAARC